MRPCATPCDPIVRLRGMHFALEACIVLGQVCEHFEEVYAIATEAADCCSAAWLCVSLLLPRHLLRLAARGAPVWEALTDASSPFLRTEVSEGLCAERPASASASVPASPPLSLPSPLPHHTAPPPTPWAQPPQVTEGLLGGYTVTGEPQAGGAAHVFPEVEDVRRGLETEREGVLNPEGALAPQVASVGPSSTEGEAAGPGVGGPPPPPPPPSSALDLLRGPIVQDLPSQLGAFHRVELVWSPATHAAFPPRARARACMLLRLRYELAARDRGLVVPTEVGLAWLRP